MPIYVTWNPTTGNPTQGVDPSAPAESSWATPATFDAHLAALTSGGTLWLAPGNYGSKRIENRAFTAQTTIRSARLDQIAEFRCSGGSGSTPALVATACTNLRLKDLKFTCPSDSGTQKWFGIVRFDGCNSPTVSTCRFDGKAADGYGRAEALGFSSSSNILVESNDIGYVHTGIYFSACNVFTVKGNTFHHIVEDCQDVLTCADGVFRENTYGPRWQDPASTTDYHPDIIQFLGHNNSNGPNRRMVMWRNRIFTAGGFWTAGFASNTMNNGSYEDFLYEENLILSSHQEALQVNGNRMTIRNNTVLYDPVYRVGAGPGNGAPSAGIAVYGGTGHVITGNLASAVPSASASISVSNNRTLVRADYATWLTGPFPTGAPLTEASATALAGNGIYTSGQGCQFTRPLDPIPAFPTLPWA